MPARRPDSSSHALFKKNDELLHNSRKHAVKCVHSGIGCALPRRNFVWVVHWTHPWLKHALKKLPQSVSSSEKKIMPVGTRKFCSGVSKEKTREALNKRHKSMEDPSALPLVDQQYRRISFSKLPHRRKMRAEDVKSQSRLLCINGAPLFVFDGQDSVPHEWMKFNGLTLSEDASIVLGGPNQYADEEEKVVVKAIGKNKQHIVEVKTNGDAFRFIARTSRHSHV